MSVGCNYPLEACKLPRSAEFSLLKQRLTETTAMLVMMCMWQDQPLKPEAFDAMRDQIKLNREILRP